MKKFLSMFLAAMLILTMIPMGAMAAEEDTSEYDELIALACEVFPEHADAIRGGASTTYARSNTSESAEILFSETRSINENESIGITTYASGVTIVVHSDSSTFTVTNTDSSYGADGTDLVGYASFTVAASNVSGYFKLSNVGFKVQEDGTSYFTYSGSPTVTNDNITYNRSTYTSAKIAYKIYFAANTFDTFSIYFSSGQLIATMGPRSG